MFIYVSRSNFKSGPDGGSPKDAVSVYDFDTSTGAFKHVQSLGGVRNPSYLARHPKLPVLYLLERWANPGETRDDRSPTTAEQQEKDCVTAYAIDPRNGTLSEMGRRSTGAPAPMHIRIHPSGQYAAFANPGRPKDPDPPEGHVTIMRLGADGALGEICGSEKYRGQAPVWRHWRPKPYPHSVFPDPAWKRIFSCYLMLDKVLIWRFDEKTGALSPSEQPYAQTSSGSGPRHMAWHPEGRCFYTVNEFDATISVFSHNAETGATAIVQTASIHPAGFEGRKDGAHIMVHPTGRFVYATNRSHQSIAIFSVDQKSGELRLIRYQSSLGERPRDFNFDPSGRFLVLTNQTGNVIVSYHIDPDTGDLRPTGHVMETHAPNCVVFGAA